MNDRRAELFRGVGVTIGVKSKWILRLSRGVGVGVYNAVNGIAGESDWMIATSEVIGYVCKVTAYLVRSVLWMDSSAGLEASYWTSDFPVPKGCIRTWNFYMNTYSIYMIACSYAKFKRIAPVNHSGRVGLYELFTVAKRFRESLGLIVIP